MAFGEKLQEVRKQSGMTQETFAEQLHVSRQAVSRWESGRGYPEIEKILYICHRYHTRSSPTSFRLSRRRRPRSSSPSPASRSSVPLLTFSAIFPPMTSSSAAR